MARSRKPCEYCDGEHWDQDEIGHNLTSSCELYPGRTIAFGITGVDDETGKEVEMFYEIPMNYCPCCGRKLEE